MSLAYKILFRRRAILLAVALGFSAAVLGVHVDVGNRWAESPLLRANGFSVHDGIAIDAAVARKHCPEVDERVRETFGDGMAGRVSDLYQAAYSHWLAGEYASEADLEEFSERAGSAAERLMYAAIEAGCETYKGWPGRGGKQFLRTLLFQAIVSNEGGEHGKVVDILSFSLDYLLSPKWRHAPGDGTYFYDDAGTLNALLYIVDRHGLIRDMAPSDRATLAARVGDCLERVHAEPWRRSLKLGLVEDALYRFGEGRHMPVSGDLSIAEFSEEWLVWRRGWVANRMLLSGLERAFATCDGRPEPSSILFRYLSEDTKALARSLEVDYTAVSLKLELLLLLCGIENYRDDTGTLPEDLSAILEGPGRLSWELGSAFHRDHSLDFSTVGDAYTITIASNGHEEGWPRDDATLYQRR